MNRFAFVGFVFAVFVFTSAAVQAGLPECDKLTGEKKVLAEKILNSVHPYSCCDETISKCLKKKNPCALAERLARRVCRLVAKGESEDKINRRLQKRAESMNSYQKKATINLAGTVPAGDVNAPVKVVVYACARCPFCSKIIPALQKEVTNGRLKGKAQLFFKPFPLKSHDYSKEGGLAMVAASDLGKFWEFTLYMYEHFDMFCVDKLADWAEMQGMDKEKFRQLMADANTRNALVESKREGLANGVKATPQLFINNKMYTGFLDIDEIVDITLEEAENSSK
ncbi:MAG: thioredoxin domain-containing protein [Deltaproteobacteria bacterium]|nr:thioredoxin domain-containing protein [Deltaproteobacteria bacterium]